MPFLLSEINMPVYGTAFTLALVERRLEEHGLLDEAKLHSVKPGDEFELGPFSHRVHPRHALHRQLRWRWPSPRRSGVIIHTGDFKVDPTPTDNELFDLHTLAEYGKRGVLLLMSDSTNVDRPGYTESERAVRPRLEDMFYRAERRLVISCFSSSIHRLQQILDRRRRIRPQGGVPRPQHDATSPRSRTTWDCCSIPDGILLRPQDIMQTDAEQGGGGGVRHAGRADVGAVARRRGQSQEPVGGAAATRWR